MNKNNIISDWLNENSDPFIDAYVRKNLAIIEQVRLALANKNWTDLQFAEALGKRPSEVSKWLSGMHNLTLKSIIKMEMALGVPLIQTQTLTGNTSQVIKRSTVIKPKITGNKLSRLKQKV